MDLSYLYLLYEHTIQKVPNFTIYRSVQSAWPGVMGGQGGSIGPGSAATRAGPGTNLKRMTHMAQ